MSEEITWFPKLDEYNPGISKDKWLEILDDRTLTLEQNLFVLACVYNFGGEATCTQLAKKYGGTQNTYNGASSSYAKRLVKAKICVEPPLRNDGSNRWWPVLYFGHDVDKDTPGSYVWKLRDELKEACAEYGIEKWLNVAPFDMTAFKKALVAYKKDFNSHIDDEIYKWKAVKQFQDYWDIKAENFSEMLDRSFSETSNLLLAQNYFPLKMLKEFSAFSPERVREAFDILYDESKPLNIRIGTFVDITDKILSEYKPDKNSYQTTNAISTYLWLRYPDKYIIYKYSEIDNVSKVLNALYEPESGSIETVEDGFNFYDQISQELKKDTDLVEMIKSKLTDSCYSDPEFKTLAIDFGFFISRYYHKNWIVPYNPNDYNVDDAFKKYEVLYWKQGKNYSVGDWVYIYVTSPQKRISYKTVVTKIDVPAEKIIHDEEFEINNKSYKDSKKMEIKLVGTSTDEGLVYSELKKRGLKSNLQSSEIIKPDMLEYIDSFFTGENNMSENAAMKYLELLIENKNLILHGAPGTGKTYLAKQIAEAMGFPKNEIGFCQFHPSYDYTDFVEGLRPIKTDDGQVGFERKDGTFKAFCKKALQNLIDSKKTFEEIKNENTFKNRYDILLEKIQEGEVTQIEQKSGINLDIVTVTNNDNIIVRTNSSDVTYTISVDRIERLAKVFSNKSELDAVKAIDKEFRAVIGGCHSSSYWAALNWIYKNTSDDEIVTTNKVEKKNYVFIIDEINRGELSKIFGELFFSIDPGYRGEKGLVNTQYQNLLYDTNDLFKDGFYIPENVYIIGTMNDIDRSVESMDFAMRRRFTFVEVTADDSAKNMNITGEALEKMNAINKAISKMPELGKAYCIGAAYFKDAKDLQKLWDLKISSLVYEYLRGIDNYTDEHKDGEKFDEIKSAYDHPELVE